MVDANGRAFVDRDGDVFPFVLRYLRDGVVDLEGHSASMVRRVKREFGYFNIELLSWVEGCFVAGGQNRKGEGMATVERFDLAGGGWQAVAPLPAPMQHVPLCSLGEGTLYAVGGVNEEDESVTAVHKYDVCTDT